MFDLGGSSKKYLCLILLQKWQILQYMDFLKILQLLLNLVRLALNNDADVLWLYVTVNANYL